MAKAREPEAETRLPYGLLRTPLLRPPPSMAGAPMQIGNHSQRRVTDAISLCQLAGWKDGVLVIYHGTVLVLIDSFYKFYSYNEKEERRVYCL